MRLVRHLVRLLVPAKLYHFREACNEIFVFEKFSRTVDNCKV
jgi:hypothetical protein